MYILLMELNKSSVTTLMELSIFWLSKLSLTWADLLLWKVLVSVGPVKYVFCVHILWSLGFFKMFREISS